MLHQLIHERGSKHTGRQATISHQVQHSFVRIVLRSQKAEVFQCVRDPVVIVSFGREREVPIDQRSPDSGHHDRHARLTGSVLLERDLPVAGDAVHQLEHHCCRNVSGQRNERRGRGIYPANVCLQLLLTHVPTSGGASIRIGKDRLQQPSSSQMDLSTGRVAFHCRPCDRRRLMSQTAWSQSRDVHRVDQAEECQRQGRATHGRVRSRPPSRSA